MCEVVDGQDGGGAGEGAARLDGVEEHGHERGGPVVDVEDVGRPPQVFAELDRAARQQAEAQQVVARHGARRIVEVAATEHLLVVQQVDGDVGARQARLEHAAPRVAGAERDAEGGGVAREVRGGNDVVAGDDDAGVVAERTKGGGQGGDHVAEATGLDEAGALGGDEEDGRRGHRGGETRTSGGETDLGSLACGGGWGRRIV